MIPILTQHDAMLQRNLLYTGVTRGKGLVVLLGQKKAGAIAVHNLSGRRRMIARRRLGPDMESVALYWAIKPHTGTLANLLRSGSTAIAPPTFSK